MDRPLRQTGDRCHLVRHESTATFPRSLLGVIEWLEGRLMPKILDNGTFRVYVYANDDNPHHLPHCHVYWDGSDHASVVSLPDLVVIVGEILPRAARRYLRANVDALMAAWRRLNP